ncbi:uncharacterized protein TA15235 [Theileria annulata]|uniref:[Phosphatase 2A protein]-leucine-carboxy methyltransferase 1 n=1 Tax=Theileria annulata TaxID=5874 RepID=Q4UFE1_THEAN|nr:uncharacterized protein TA15235 [Theileria annulata]CAI74175.1 hypothetical protein TA15235 [Theileria annulata]|eukprot:XP_951907.1 hypothetical protein TA15235 [Theileria annulata]
MSLFINFRSLRISQIFLIFVSFLPINLNLVHVVRVNAFRLVLDKFIESFPDQTVQFVNLGAGFDTISFYALKKYPNVICFDTDFDDQMKTKSKIVYENDCFKQLLPDLKLENGFITSNRYKIVSTS